MSTSTPQAALLSKRELSSLLKSAAESIDSCNIVMTHWEVVARAVEQAVLAKLQATQAEPVQAGELPPLPDPKYIYHNYGGPRGEDELFEFAHSGAVDEGCEHCTRLYTADKMQAYARAALSARKPLTDETFVAACNGCPTPGKCKDTSGCASAGMNVPTYYVRHPDDTYTAADPQPRFNGIGLEVKP